MPWTAAEQSTCWTRGSRHSGTQPAFAAPLSRQGPPLLMSREAPAIDQAMPTKTSARRKKVIVPLRPWRYDTAVERGREAWGEAMSNVPGVLLHHFGAAVVLALPVSLIVLAWYRCAVLRQMLARGSAGGDGDRATTRPAQRAGREGAAAPSAKQLRMRMAVVYTLGAMAASAVSTSLYLIVVGIPFAALRAFMIGYAFAWPLVPTLALLLTLSLRRSVLLALAYYLAGAVVILLGSLVSAFVLGRPGVSPLGNVVSYTGFLALEALAPLVVIAVTGGRKLRPVAPLVLAGLLVFSFSASVLQAAFLSLVNSASLRG